MSLSKWIRAAITLFLICRRCICDVAAERLGYFSDKWEHAPPRRDWDDQCCRPLLFSYRNSIPGSTGGHVAGASAANENQAVICPIFNCCLVKYNYWWRQTYSALYYNNFSLKIFRRFQLALCSQVILMNQVALTKIGRCPQYTTIDTIVYCHQSTIKSYNRKF